MRIQTYIHRASRFVMRNRSLLQDLFFVVVFVLGTAYILFEVDVFVTEELRPKAIQPEEWPILGAVVTLALLVFSWRRFIEQKHELRKRIEAEEQIRRLAFQDPLTGLPNRRQFGDALKVAVGAPPRAGGVHALLMLDLNGFKRVNDLYGHGVGDQLLGAASERLMTSVREGDMVARLGGDEFAVLAQHLSSAEEATSLALRIATALELPINAGKTDHYISTGIGICLFPFSRATEEEVMRRADVALYKAKSDGSTSARFFDSELDRYVRERNLMESELRTAIARREIAPFFQPVVDLATKEIIGFEALARWRHRDLGEIAPERFLPIAEDCLLLGEVTDDLFRQACLSASSWPSRVSLSFNISPAQLRDPTLGLRMLAILAETELSPRRLQVEITESALVRDLASAEAALGGLRQAGVRIALDDFGTGYASLYHLRNFNLDKVKIDRSFISRMPVERESVEVVNALLGLGLGLGFTVSAEGIENDDQALRLLERGCQEGQGHLYGAAVSAEEAEKLFDRSRATISMARVAV